jgi:hypothetical protein
MEFYHKGDQEYVDKGWRDMGGDERISRRSK